MFKCLRLLCLLSFLIPAITNAQPKNKDELRVFIDCNAWCDMSFIKTEINYVDFVPDRFLANVFIMITSQTTGSGGEEIKLMMGGQENFKGMNDTLQFYRESVNTDDEYRRNLVQYLKLGLTRYLAKTSLAGKLDITATINKNETATNDLSNKKDKWNFWVYNVGVSGNYSADDYSRSYRASGQLSASRVTEKMKINLRANVSTNERMINFNGTKSSFNNNSYGFNSTVVKSLSTHLSAGGFGSFNHNTYSNYSQQFTLMPAIEYSYFPYKDAVKKSITLFYQVGPSYNSYIDTAYYNSPHHLVFSQKLSLNVGYTQKWGNLNFNANWGNFLNAFTLDSGRVKGRNVNTLSLGTYLEVRIIKGLSFYVSSSADFTKGIYPNIPRKFFSRDDLLTNTRQYPTQKGLYSYFGINYRFGSIYNNVVNPRFNQTRYD
jgi:hypothetical protein